VSRKQTEFSAQVRDNLSNVLLACVHIPGKFYSCNPRSARSGARGSLLADFGICFIAVCANLATCILDVKDGYCGICYQSLIPAALEKSSEDFTEFYKHQGTRGSLLHYIYWLARS